MTTTPLPGANVTVGVIAAGVDGGEGLDGGVTGGVVGGVVTGGVVGGVTGGVVGGVVGGSGGVVSPELLGIR